MYSSINFKTKKAFKDAIVAGKKVTLFAPGLGNPLVNGKCVVEGPHFPEPHKWYANVKVIDGYVVEVK